MDAVKIVRANTDSSSRSPYVSAYLWDEWHAKVFFHWHVASKKYQLSLIQRAVVFCISRHCKQSLRMKTTVSLFI